MHLCSATIVSARSILHLCIYYCARHPATSHLILRSTVYTHRPHATAATFFLWCAAQTMEAGGSVGGRGVLAAVGVRAAAVGDTQIIIRVMVRIHTFLGLAGVVFALCLATLHPWVSMRTHGLLLLLSAGAHASAPVVAALAQNARTLLLAWKLHLAGVSAIAAAFATSSCAGHLDVHKADFIADDVPLLCVFYLVGLAWPMAVAAAL